jgi:hypothetical protein
MLLQTVRAAVALGVLLMSVTTPAAAHSPRSETATVVQAAAIAIRDRGQAPVRFDWMANRPDQARRAAQPAPGQTRVPGRGGYICSAAGFGEMSRCVER